MPSVLLPFAPPPNILLQQPECLFQGFHRRIKPFTIWLAEVVLKLRLRLRDENVMH